jgi:uncharacterized protein (DUF427 family)
MPRAAVVVDDVMTKPILTPSADHPITVEPTDKRVRVTAGDIVIADSTHALALQESTYPVAYYVPLTDVDLSVLRRTDSETYCPYKGEASYYSVVTDAGEIADAVWEYEKPYDAVAPIQGHVAFYPDRVTIAAG